MVIANNHYRMLTPLHNSASTYTLKTFFHNASNLHFHSLLTRSAMTNKWIELTAKNMGKESVWKLETMQEFNGEGLSFRKTAGPEVGCPQPRSQKHGQDQTPALSHTKGCQTSQNGSLLPVASWQKCVPLESTMLLESFLKSEGVMSLDFITVSGAFNINTTWKMVPFQTQNMQKTCLWGRECQREPRDERDTW